MPLLRSVEEGCGAGKRRGNGRGGEGLMNCMVELDVSLCELYAELNFARVRPLRVVLAQDGRETLPRAQLPV